MIVILMEIILFSVAIENQIIRMKAKAVFSFCQTSKIIKYERRLEYNSIFLFNFKSFPRFKTSPCDNVTNLSKYSQKGVWWCALSESFWRHITCLTMMESLYSIPHILFIKLVIFKYSSTQHHQTTLLLCPLLVDGISIWVVKP